MRNDPTFLVVDFVPDGDGWQAALVNDAIPQTNLIGPVRTLAEARRLANRNGYLLRFDQRVWDAMVDSGAIDADELGEDVSRYIRGLTTDQERLNSAFAAAAVDFDAQGHPSAARSARACARFAWHLSNDEAASCLYVLDAGTNLLAESFEFENCAPEMVVAKLLA